MDTSLVLKTDALEVAGHVGTLMEFSSRLLDSGLLPSTLKKPEAVMVVLLKGKELGIPPMQALSHIYVVSGKPTLSAELMLAMMLEAGHDVWIEHTDSSKCTVKGIRRGKKREQSLTFTLKDAQQAGVTSNPTWKKYPDAMLRARAISAFARMFAPDVLMGASYTPEELGAKVTEDGDVLDVSPVTVTREPEYEDAPYQAAEEPEPEPEDDGQFPEDGPTTLFETKEERQERKPVLLSKEKAADLSAKLAEIGTPKKAQLELVRNALGRDDVKALTDLNTGEALKVWRFANGETVTAPAEGNAEQAEAVA